MAVPDCFQPRRTVGSLHPMPPWLVRTQASAYTPPGSPMFGMSRLRRLVDAGRTLGPARMVPSLLRWSIRREFVVFARDLRVPASDEIPDPALRWTDLSVGTAPLLRAIDPALDEVEVERARREG